MQSFCEVANRFFTQGDMVTKRCLTTLLNNLNEQ